MKKILTVLAVWLLCSFCECWAQDAVTEPKQAQQFVEMTNNKVVVNVQKQPLNEYSNQSIVLKKNWFVVNIQINGKVKVKPMQMQYEVE